MPGKVTNMHCLVVLFLLAFPLSTVSTPSWQFSVKLSGNYASPSDSSVSVLSEEIPTFDDDRVKDYPDKKLLTRLRTFFKTFTTGDFDGMHDLQSTNYTMTNIRKSSHPFAFRSSCLESSSVPFEILMNSTGQISEW